MAASYKFFESVFQPTEWFWVFFLYRSVRSVKPLRKQDSVVFSVFVCSVGIPHSEWMIKPSKVDSLKHFSAAPQCWNQMSLKRWDSTQFDFLINTAALPYRLWPRTNTRCTRVFPRRPSGCAAPKSPNSAWRSPCQRWPWGRNTTAEKKVLTQPHHTPPLPTVKQDASPGYNLIFIWQQRGWERGEIRKFCDTFCSQGSNLRGRNKSERMIHWKGWKLRRKQGKWETGRYRSRSIVVTKKKRQITHAGSFSAKDLLGSDCDKIGLLLCRPTSDEKGLSYRE